jgi:hypothetical protein
MSVRYRHGGEERKRFARTYAEARAIKQTVERGGTGRGL